MSNSSSSNEQCIVNNATFPKNASGIIDYYSTCYRNETILNPFCTDTNPPLAGCLNISDCLAPNGKWTAQTANAGCANWVCSLRLNCGCLTGNTTNCFAYPSQRGAKSGCNLILEMFNEIGCDFNTFFPNQSITSSLVQSQCFAGCPNEASKVSTTTLPSLLVLCTYYVLFL